MQLIEVKVVPAFNGPTAYQVHVDGWGLFWLVFGLLFVWGLFRKP